MISHQPNEVRHKSIQLFLIFSLAQFFVNSHFLGKSHHHFQVTQWPIVNYSNWVVYQIRWDEQRESEYFGIILWIFLKTWRTLGVHKKHEAVLFLVEDGLRPNPNSLSAARYRWVYFELHHISCTPSPVRFISLLSKQLLPVLIFPTMLVKPTSTLHDAIKAKVY